MRLTFDINYRGEPNAGLQPYTDRVVIDVESGDPGGEEGDFAREVHHFLEEWFDGAEVTPC